MVNAIPGRNLSVLNCAYHLPKPWTDRFALVNTAVSRKVVGRNVHATTPKGNMGYDQYTVPNDCSCRTYFCCFPLALANICPWPLVPFFQISLENRADKTTHNTFGDCHVHFFRQLFSKQLYMVNNSCLLGVESACLITSSFSGFSQGCAPTCRCCISRMGWFCFKKNIQENIVVFPKCMLDISTADSLSTTLIHLNYTISD